jgi:hypothetical protein
MSTDILKRGTEWLASTLMQKASTKVSYAVGGEEPQEIYTTIGMSMFRVDEDGVSKIVRTDRDFIFRVSDLRKIGVAEPSLGDMINDVRTIGGDVISRWYLVSAPNGEKAYRQADGRDDLIRVHTKLDKEEVLQ